MPYEMKWYDDEHTIIQLDMYDRVTWDGWYEVMDKIYAELDKSSHRVDVIFHDTAGLPDGNPLPHLKHTITKFEKYDNLGKIVSVNAKRNPTLPQAMVNVVTNAMQIQGKKRGPFCDTLDEALSFIEKDRQV